MQKQGPRTYVVVGRIWSVTTCFAIDVYYDLLNSYIVSCRNYILFDVLSKNRICVYKEIIINQNSMIWLEK